MNLGKGKINQFLSVACHCQSHRDNINLFIIQKIEGLIHITADHKFQVYIQKISKLLKHFKLITHGFSPVNKIIGGVIISEGNQGITIQDPLQALILKQQLSIIQDVTHFIIMATKA